MSDDKQARFGRPLDHIVLKPEQGRRAPRPAVKKKKGPFPSRSSTDYQTLTKQISKVHQDALARTRVLESPRIHFVIELSDKIAWKPIANSVVKLGLSIVKYVDEKTIRVSMKKDAYQSFLSSLENNSKYIQNIREIGVFEKIDPVFYDEITKRPEEKNWVTIEFSNVSGLEDLGFVEEAIETWIEKGNYGTIKRSYQSDTTLLLSGFLANKSIEAIAKEVEPLSYVAKIPKMELGGIRTELPLTLSSIIPLGEITKGYKQASLQSIVVIDSGINRNHKSLRNSVQDTFDYSTRNQNPCDDSQGHGSSVSGLAIYGDDLRKASSASAKVIVVKNFDQSGEINHDVIEVIRDTIQKYRFSSRILNLSFNAQGPNPSMTKAMDEIVFWSDYVVVVSAGNISVNTITSFMDSGVGYPDYLNSQIVFFPADCRNVVTVGSYTEYSSNFVPRDYPSPFTKSGFSSDFVKPEIMASGGNLERSSIAGRNTIFLKQGLGVVSASHINDQQVEQFGTSFSSPIVANIAASIIEKRVDLSAFLVKALLISSCDPMLNVSNSSAFSETLQGFGKVDRTRAVNSQEWRVCYLMQGEFDSNGPDFYHRYLFLFPEQADQLDVTAVCGKLVTGHSQEINEYIQLFFKRPGVRMRTPLRKGLRIGRKKCHCTYRERLRIERGSRGAWRVDVVPHFSNLPIQQKIKYGIVIAVSSSKMNDIYSLIMKWVEPQKERILVPATARSP